MECSTSRISSLGKSCCRVRVTRDGNEVKVEVRDQGKETPSGGNGAYKKVGVGIQGMRERIKQFGGRFEIRSDKERSYGDRDRTSAEFVARTANQLAS